MNSTNTASPLAELVRQGKQHYQAGRLKKAEKFYRQVLLLDPVHPEALYHLGMIAGSMGEYQAAVTFFLRAIELNPDRAYLHFYIAAAYELLGDPAKADQAYRRAATLEPKNPEIFFRWGKFLSNHRLNEAAALLQYALKLDPQDTMRSDINICLFEVLYSSGEIERLIDICKAQLARKKDPAVHSLMLLCLHYRSTWSRERIFEAHRAFDENYGRKQPVILHGKDRNPDRKLRIGYLAVDFQKHLGGYFIKPLLDLYDRSQFEIYLYHLPILGKLRTDETTDHLRRQATAYRPISDPNDEELSKRIRADGIDIMVDLCGHTPGNRLMAFARKPAPVQVTWLGYADTTGMSAIDYRVVDEISDPPNESEALVTEKLVWMQGGFLGLAPSPDAPPVGELPVLSNRHVTFGSFQIIQKHSDEVLALWAKILSQVPESRLLLKTLYFDREYNRVIFRDRLAALGVSTERIELIGSTEGHLEYYNKLDIALDTFPYNGTISTCDALWMGVPVVTLYGDRHVARVGGSILTHAGLGDLVAKTQADYLRIAVALANDLPRLAALRRSMRHRLSHSPLCDTARLTRSMEIAYRAMWRQWCAGQPPAAMRVSPVEAIAVECVR